MLLVNQNDELDTSWRTIKKLREQIKKTDKAIAELLGNQIAENMFELLTQHNSKVKKSLKQKGLINLGGINITSKTKKS